MDDFPRSATGNHLIPEWSLRDGLAFLSFLASPDDIPIAAPKYLSHNPRLLHKKASEITLTDLDYTKDPVWFAPEENWLSWIPLNSLDSTSTDPLNFLFDTISVDMDSEYQDVYGEDSEAEDQAIPKSHFIGYRLDVGWANQMSSTGRRVSDVIDQIVNASAWCSSRHGGGAKIDRPEPFDDYLVFALHQSEDEAGRAVISSKRSILSLMGFLSWLQSLVAFDKILMPSEARFIESLTLGQRGKTGVLYHLKRDYHEANIPHLLAHQVPVHQEKVTLQYSAMLSMYHL
ncbi:hypothetical protein K438DRAFT_1787707 [Mycena galopus ATCC 62051]|nr:hypothetical protein K438DRAFT_1787707 [Mycena galopus ATCC 62051]